MTSRGRSDWLKLVAMITMLLDHVGVLLLPRTDLLRVVGRLSFPIFAYGIARGMRFTRDRKKYLLLLFAVGALSQIPYMWLSYDARFDPYTINQLWQFLYSALVILVLERAMNSESLPNKIVLGGLTLLLAFVPDIVRYYDPRWSFSYGTYGVLMSLLFFLFDGKWAAIALSYAALSLYYGYNIALRELGPAENLHYLPALLNFGPNWELMNRYGKFLRMSGIFVQNFSVYALPLIALSEQSPGTFRMPRYVAYLFYPLHISILLIIHFLGVL